MRRRFLSLALAFCTLTLLTLSACTAENRFESSTALEDGYSSSIAEASADAANETPHGNALQISVGGKDFTAVLEENAAVRVLNYGLKIYLIDEMLMYKISLEYILS